MTLGSVRDVNAYLTAFKGAFFWGKERTEELLRREDLRSTNIPSARVRTNLRTVTDVTTIEDLTVQIEVTENPVRVS